MKIYDYLLYIRDMKEFERILDAINDEFDLKCQFAIERPCGSVTEGYRDKNGRFEDTKSIIGRYSLYEEQKEAFEMLINRAHKYPEVYSEFNIEVYIELVDRFPKILQANKWVDWGFCAKNWERYPSEREVCISNLVEIECYECYEEFNVCGEARDFNGEKLQCPHCKEVLEVELDYTIRLTGRKAE